MVENSVETYLQSPTYRQAVQNCQKGDWPAALTLLDELEKAFPLEPDLRTWRQELLLRSKMDQVEEGEVKRQQRIFIQHLATRLGIILVTILLVIWGLQIFARPIQQQWEQTKRQVDEDAQAAVLAAKFRNGQDLLQAGRPLEAKAWFDEIAAENPNYENLDVVMAQAAQMLTIEQDYQEALRLAEQGEIEAALALFRDIESRDPKYKDVTIQVRNLQKGLSSEEQFAVAMTAFGNDQWVAAIAAFEALKNSNLNYRKAEVEDFLYQSYINAAEEKLTQQEPTLEALTDADGYYRKALALRPQNQEIINRKAQARASVEEYLVNSYMNAATQALTGQADSLNALRIAEENFAAALNLRPDDLTITTQFDLARKYISGVENYNRGLWSKVIADLEIVYGEDPDYASGTCRQTLYEAYVARGKNGLASGDYMSALSDYQRAAVLALDAPDAGLRLYEAQLKVAYALGLTGNYQDAVLIYRENLNNSGVAERVITNRELQESIDQAKTSADAGNYERAYYLYRDTLEKSDLVYERTTYVVQKGEYVTMLARKYNSTVEAILEANGLSDLSKVTENLVLVIPSLP
jgi:tetratricopeptide (TPR) repeat protein